jgi:excinuclease ABC subunit C
MEAYDISHTSGTEVVGVLVVSIDGVFAKSEYRKFVLSVQKNDDVGQLTEIVTRRLKHSEWPLPDIVIADGGLPQKNAIEKLLPEESHIQVVSVLKDEHHTAKEILGLSQHTQKHSKEILALNAEAHRFAITYHRRRMRQRLTT